MGSERTLSDSSFGITWTSRQRKSHSGTNFRAGIQRERSAQERRMMFTRQFESVSYSWEMTLEIRSGPCNTKKFLTLLPSFPPSVHINWSSHHTPPWGVSDILLIHYCVRSSLKLSLPRAVRLFCPWSSLPLLGNPHCHLTNPPASWSLLKPVLILSGTKTKWLILVPSVG